MLHWSQGQQAVPWNDRDRPVYECIQTAEIDAEAKARSLGNCATVDLCGGGTSVRDIVVVTLGRFNPRHPVSTVGNIFYFLFFAVLLTRFRHGDGRVTEQYILSQDPCGEVRNDRNHLPRRVGTMPGKRGGAVGFSSPKNPGACSRLKPGCRGPSAAASQFPKEGGSAQSPIRMNNVPNLSTTTRYLLRRRGKRVRSQQLTRMRTARWSPSVHSESDDVVAFVGNFLTSLRRRRGVMGGSLTVARSLDVAYLSFTFAVVCCPLVELVGNRKGLSKCPN